MKMVFTRVITAAVGFGFIGLLVLANVALTVTPAAGQTAVIYGKAADPTSLDPGWMSVNRENSVVQKAFYETLVFRDQDEKVGPWLATSWEQSNNYKTWVFHLRKGVKFHDGEPLNAEAVRFSLERFLKGKGGNAIYYDYADKDSCKVVDESTVRIDLLTSNPLFLNDCYLGGYAPISPKYVKAHATPDDPWAFKWMNDHECGTGPYKLVEWTRGQKMIYERNKDYWGGPQVGKGCPKAPYLDRVVELVIPNSSTRRMALETGEIDIVEGLPPDDIVKMQADPKLKVEKFRAPWVVYLAYDVRYPPFNDKNVRKAISYAINYDQIISGPERGMAERLWSVNHNYALGSAPEKYVKYNYDPEKARQLLKQTKYPNGFTTEMYYPPERRGQFEEIAVLLQSYLKDVGIDVKLRKVAFPTQLEAQSKGNYGLALIVYKASDADPENGIGWMICPDRDTGGWDPTHWEDPIAHNTTKGRETNDINERVRLYQELAIKAADEAIYVPLYQFGLYFPMKKNIEGFFFDTDTGPAFWEIKNK